MDEKTRYTFDELYEARNSLIQRNKEIIFNTISSNDNINIICSFKEGVIQDKRRFEECQPVETFCT